MYSAHYFGKISRNKLFRFRSSLSSAKQTILTKFPVTMKRVSNKRALQTTISSAREKKSICAGDENEVLLLLLDLTVVDIFSSLVRTAESVVVAGCNLLIPQTLTFGKKKVFRIKKTCKGQRGIISDKRLFEEDLL